MIERDGRVIQRIWQIRSGNIKDEKPQELFKSNKGKFVQNVGMNRFINGSKFLRER